MVANNYQGPFRQYKANNQGDVKIEYGPGAKDKITGFFSISTAYDGQTATSQSDALAISFPGIDLYPTHVLGSNWVHTFSPSLINAARAGFTRTNWNVGLPSDPTGIFGTSGDSKVGITFTDQAYNGFTGQQISNGASTVGNQALNNGTIIDNTFSYIDNLSWQRGLHYLSTGVQALRYQQNYPTSNNSGYLGKPKLHRRLQHERSRERRLGTRRLRPRPRSVRSGYPYQPQRRPASVPHGRLLQRRL